MSSPRKTMRSAMAECLQRIRAADGYRTDLGLSVELEPAPALSEDQKPFLTVVWSRQVRAEDRALVKTHRLTTFDVVAKVPATLIDAQDVLDAIVSDIESAMENQQFRYPIGYSFPQYQSAEPLMGHFGSGWIGATVSYLSNIPIK